jgi:hypothetical protein
MQMTYKRIAMLLTIACVALIAGIVTTLRRPPVIIVRPQGCGQSAALTRPWSVYPNPVYRKRIYRA